MEELRRKNIKYAIKKRRDLINNSLENNKNEIQKCSSAINLREKISSIDVESKKMRQIMILKSKIKYELKLSEREKQNKLKYLSLEKNIDGIKLFRKKLKDEKILKEQLSDMQRRERLNLDYREYLKHQNEIKKRNQRIESNVEKVQREKFEENKWKKIVSQHKEDEFKLRLEHKNAEELDNINNQIKNLRLKFEIQKKNYEDIQKEKGAENHEKTKNTEEKTIKALNSISEFANNFYNSKKNKMEVKSERVNKNRKKLFDERKEKAREQNTLFLEKEKYISDYFRKYEKNLEKKGEQFNKKYLNMTLRKVDFDSKVKENLRMRNLILSQKENKCKQSRLKEEKENELNRKRLFEKITNSHNQMTMRRLKNNSDLKEKFTDLNLKMEDISQNLKRQENLRELKRIQKIEKLLEKDKKLEQLKYLKFQMKEQRRKINENIANDKERLLDRYSILRQNENISYDDILKELFPEDYDENSNYYV